MGLSPSEWEELTPGQFYAWTNGYMEKMKSERQMRNADIYNLASLIRTAVWSKHMPKYDTVFRENRRKKEMTDEEMYSTVLALNAMFGGERI